MNNKEITIVYIVTGIYKQFFENFLESLKNLFIGYPKHLIVISDGLVEYHNKKYGETLIHIEEFIDYPYPTINYNKFQIVHHYAQKYNAQNIMYFDAETIINEYDQCINNFLLDKINDNKIVTMWTGVFQHKNLNDFFWGTDFCSLYGYYFGNFDDFHLVNRYMQIYKGNKWIQTSFFMTNLSTLEYFANKIKKFINYNNRMINMKLNFSDEAIFNYFNYYTDSDKIYADFFNREIDQSNIKDDIDLSHVFFTHKYKSPIEKAKIKFLTNNKLELFILYNENSLEYVENVNKFFINNFDKIKISGFGCKQNNDYYSYQCFNCYTPIFNRYIELDNDSFECDKCILKDKDFYYDDIDINNFIYTNDHDYIIPYCIPNVYGFIVNFTDNVYNFDYNEFIEGEYDYIEGKSFDDFNNLNDIDFVVFSKKYIKAWLDNNIDFTPKVYELK